MTWFKHAKTLRFVAPGAAFLLDILWCEVVFRLTLAGAAPVGPVFAALFGGAAALLLCGVLTLLPPRAAKVLMGLAGLVLWFFYLSQAVYYRVFQTCYPVYSLLNGGQVMEFWQQIMGAFADRWWQCLLLSVPFAALLLGLRKWQFVRAPRPGVAMAFAALLWHSLAVCALPLDGTDAGSAYDLYHNGGSIRAAAGRLGLLTAFRLDAERTLFGLSGGSLTPVSAEPEAAPETPDEPVVYAPNALDIDFAALAESETDPAVRELHQFFAARQPTLQNEMTGIYEGYNLIYLTAEGFSPYAVDATLTPTLYKLVHEGYYFTNFYNPVWNVSTIDGEYVNCLGLVPKTGVWSLYQMRNNLLPFALGNQFRALGYQTNAYHDHTYDYYRREVSHPNLGYDYKGLGSGVHVTEVWPESDLEMMQDTMPEYVGNSPFHVYYMTVSGHMEYNFFGNAQAAKHQSEVQELPYSDACRAYVACNIELDRALAYLLEQLEQAGVADKTVIAMAPDHYPYGLTDEQISEFLGHSVETEFEKYRSTLVLYVPGMEPQTVDKLCWSGDIMPTLSNLFGLPYDSRLLTGRDIFSTAAPFILFEDRSFITDRVQYNALTGEAVWAAGETADADYLAAMQQAVAAEFTADARILETDYYRRVLGG